MHHPFHRRFLISSSAVLPGSLRPVTVTKALLTDDGTRRITLKQIGGACSQNIDTLVAGSWQRTTCRLQRRQLLRLWPMIHLKPLEMMRFAGKWQGIPAWVDQYQGHLEGLHVATFRFRSVTDAFVWNVPPMLGPEVTLDPRFRGVSLMKEGLQVRKLPVDLVRDKSNFVVGVLPYLQTPGNVEVVAVHTRKKALTIFPKGQPEPNLGAQEVARLEALEEAGIEGCFSGHPMLMPYKDSDPQHWVLYPLEVRRILSEWKEKGIRNRRLINLQEALSHPSCIRLLPALRLLQLSLGYQAFPQSVD